MAGVRNTDVFYPDRVVNGQFVTPAVKALMREMENEQVEVCIRRRRAYVTIPQHRYYRGLVIAMIGAALREAGITGPHGGPITNEQAHEVMAAKFLRTTVVIDFDTGDCVDLIKSTAKLTAAEMSEYVDRVREYALNHMDLFIPDAEAAKGMRMAS